MNQDIKSKAEALKYAIEFTAEDGKPNYKAAQELFDFICQNLSVYEGAVEEAQNPRCSVIAEGTKEKERANSSYCKEVNSIHEILHKRGYKCVSGMSPNGFRTSLFRLENDNESLEVVINRTPKNKIALNDTEVEITTVRRYLIARGYIIFTGSNEPETFVHHKLNIKIAFV